MFTPEQYREKAAKFTELAKSAVGPDEAREFRQRERSFSTLADNEQWLNDHRDHMVRAPARSDLDSGFPVVDDEDETGLAAEEERVLRCLGAALIMRWNALPTKLQRELFDSAVSAGDLLDTAALRGQVARFLHNHKDDEDTLAMPRMPGVMAGNGYASAALTMIPNAMAHPAALQHAAAIARWDNEGGAPRDAGGADHPISCAGAGPGPA